MEPSHISYMMIFIKEHRMLNQFPFSTSIYRFRKKTPTIELDSQYISIYTKLQGTIWGIPKVLFQIRKFLICRVRKCKYFLQTHFQSLRSCKKKLIHPYHVVIQANLEKKLRVKNKRTTGKRKRREKLSWGWGQREILKLC